MDVEHYLTFWNIMQLEVRIDELKRWKASCRVDSVCDDMDVRIKNLQNQLNLLTRENKAQNVIRYLEIESKKRSEHEDLLEDH